MSKQCLFLCAWRHGTCSNELFAAWEPSRLLVSSIWLRLEMAQFSFSPGKPVLLKKSWVALKASAPSWNCLDMSKLYNSLWCLNSSVLARRGTEVFVVCPMSPLAALDPASRAQVSKGDVSTVWQAQGEGLGAAWLWELGCSDANPVSAEAGWEGQKCGNRISSRQNIYIFFLPAPRETFESLRAAFHIVAQVELCWINSCFSAVEI